MSSIFGALGRNVVRFRWLVIAIWIVGTIAAVKTLPSLGSQVDTSNSAFLPAAAPSNEAAKLAAPIFGSMTQSQITVVAVKSGSPFDASEKTAMTSAIGGLSHVGSIEHVAFAGESSDQMAEQWQVTSSVAPFDQTGTRNLIGHLDHALDKSRFPSGVQVNLAGTVASNVANQKQSNRQGNQIQMFSLLFILILLCVIFRSVLAPFVTLLGPVFALGVSGSLIGLLGSHGLKISFFTQILLIILLLGAGTDYGLFLVFRVREELHGGKTPHEAVAYSMARVGESITASAGTVILALLSLTLASFGIYRDLGIPLAIGIAVMLLAGLTLLPALLSVMGNAVFWPTKTTPRPHVDGIWGRIAGRLVRRPVTTLVVGILIFGALSVFIVGYKSGGFGGKTMAPVGSSAAAGNAALAAHFKGSNTSPTVVVMRFDTPVWNSPKALGVATTDLDQSGEFSSIQGPLDPNGAPLTYASLHTLHDELHVPPQRLLRTIPTDIAVSQGQFNAYVAEARFISPDGHTVEWEVGLKAGGPQSTAAEQAIPDIRQAVTQAAHHAGAQASGVAGEAPALYDVGSISASDLRHIIPIAVVAIGLLLVLVLRSLIAPIYLIVSVVLSYLASLGLAVLFFMKLDGQSGIVFLLPFLMFVFLLALGEDYNILVMTRIREEAQRRPLREAVVRAIGTTGPTVTSAGLVLAGSFAVLAIVGGSGSTGTSVREIGFGLMIGILLDTFIVRTVLVPSTVALLGRWNWWPTKLGHVDPSDPPEASIP